MLCQIMSVDKIFDKSIFKVFEIQIIKCCDPAKFGKSTELHLGEATQKKKHLLGGGTPHIVM